MTDRMIDALIAEKLFGWKWYTSPNGFSVLFSPSDSMLVNTEDAPCYVEREGPYQRTPNYSTDPATSRQLREKLAERNAGHVFNVTWQLNLVEGEYRFYCGAFCAFADTEERAVALCALKTVGVDPTPSPQ